MKNLIVIFLISLVFISCGKNQKTVESTKETTEESNEKSLNKNVSENSVNEGQNKSEVISDGIKILEFRKGDLNSDTKYKGNIVSGAKWIDKNGENILIISETDVKNYLNDGNEVTSKEIHAYCYVVTENKTQLLWDIVDFVKDCPLDMRVEFIPKSLSVTDINKNGIGENTFLYALSCKGDVSPDDLKLMMHEGNVKYALRGDTKIQYEIDGKTHSEGGEFKADNAFSSAPPGFLDYAKEQWSKFNIQKY